jgi:uncharacterized protein
MRRHLPLQKTTEEDRLKRASVRPLPPYAYVPGGRFPHPTRDPGGHSFGVEEVQHEGALIGSEPFRWGVELFDNGYYWEAHEAWEGLWRAADRADPRRLLLKGLILLAAAGVKELQGIRKGARRHYLRAASLFDAVARQARELDGAVGTSLETLSEQARLRATCEERAPSRLRLNSS